MCFVSQRGRYQRRERIDAGGEAVSVSSASFIASFLPTPNCRSLSFCLLTLSTLSSHAFSSPPSSWLPSPVGYHLNDGLEALSSTSGPIQLVACTPPARQRTSPALNSNLPLKIFHPLSSFDIAPSSLFAPVNFLLDDTRLPSVPRTSRRHSSHSPNGSQSRLQPTPNTGQTGAHLGPIRGPHRSPR